MTRRRLALLCLAVVALAALGVTVAARVRRRRLAPFRERTREYLRLAVAHDSVALARRSVDEDMAAYVLGTVALHPGQVEEALGTLELRRGDYSAGEVQVSYDSAVDFCPGNSSPPPPIQLRFVWRDGQWKVKSAAVGVC